MSYFDLGILIAVALFALLGLWKGFFKTVISFCGWFVSFLIAFFLTKPVVGALLDIGGVRNLVVGTGKGWSIYSWIYGKLPVVENLTGSLEIVLSPFVRIAGIVGGDMRQNVALLIANGIFSVVVCIGLLLLLRLLLLLLTMFANAMTRGKLVGGLNRLLGFVAGIFRGLGLVVIVMFFLTFPMGLSFMAPVRAQLDASVLAKPLYSTVSSATDKFITGGEGMLRKLLNIVGQEEDEEPGASEAGPEVGVYYMSDGIARYALELRADKTCVLTVTQEGVENRNERTGTYTLDGTELTLSLTDPDEESSGTYNAAGWLHLEGLGGYYAKEGVIPPQEIEYGAVDGTYTYSDGEVTYTLTLVTGEEENSFSLYNSATEETLEGVFDAADGEITLTYDNGDSQSGTYDATTITIGEIVYTRAEQ